MSHWRRREFITLLGGAMAALPSLAPAQQAGRMPTVAYLWHAGNAEEEAPFYGTLVEAFAKLGYVDGRNFRLLHRFPNEIPENFRKMAVELASLKVDVLMSGSVAAPHLKEATLTIPIVFMFVPDPVGMKLVQSLAKPGGNITGLSNFGSDIAGKRLQLLKEMVPGLSRVGFLVNPNLPMTRMYIDVMGSAANELRLELRMFEARALNEMEPAFDQMVQAGMQAATIAQGGTAFQARHLNPKLALDRRIPLCAYSRETFEAGALVSYGPDNIESIRRSALYADKILKGEKPANIPVEQPTKFELLINMKTAKTLGLEVPLHLQQTANEVVE
jgi:putative tryptophan/tyrosine transport system substrate-binding protein